MGALSLLLNRVYEDVFLTYSHGFRKGRGPITFFAHVDSWGTVDRFIKADIVGCFDNIDHTLLNRRIGLDMGESSEGFCNSIFLLKDGNKRERRYYGSCIKKGIPQGSPLSPVLMNIFLHQLDVKMQDFMSKEARIRYVRYDDDIAFAIKEGANSEMVSQGFKQFFNEALTELKLEATSLELVRGISKPCSTLVLGVLISIRPDRQLELRAAINR